MSRNVTKAMGNRYCQARLEAAKYNEKLLVRSSAVEFLPGVTEDSLKKYELDINRPPNTVVALMADAYSAPDLTAWYGVFLSLISPLLLALCLFAIIKTLFSFSNYPIFSIN